MEQKVSIGEHSYIEGVEIILDDGTDDSYLSTAIFTLSEFDTIVDEYLQWKMNQQG